MANLRDKGYPSAKEYIPNISDKRNAIMDASTPVVVGKYSSNMGMNQTSPNEDAIKRLLTVYNSRAFGIPGAPLINDSNLDYVDSTDSRAFMSGYDLRNHNNDRLGFVHRTVTPTETNYYVGVDNLPFGTNYVSKDFTTPLGNITTEYDGDGTAVLGYETNPNAYYIAALARALMNRGNL